MVNQRQAHYRQTPTLHFSLKWSLFCGVIGTFSTLCLCRLQIAPYKKIKRPIFLLSGLNIEWPADLLREETPCAILAWRNHRLRGSPISKRTARPTSQIITNIHFSPLWVKVDIDNWPPRWPSGCKPAADQGNFQELAMAQTPVRYSPFSFSLECGRAKYPHQLVKFDIQLQNALGAL